MIIVYLCAFEFFLQIPLFLVSLRGLVQRICRLRYFCKYQKIKINDDSNNNDDDSDNGDNNKYDDTDMEFVKKNLHRRIFRKKNLHRQFHLILMVLVRKKHKK